MGTYIAAFVEYDQSQGQPPFSDPVQVESLTEGSFLLPPEYDVFDALGFGRHAAMRRQDQIEALRPKYRPRGIPTPVSSATAHAYFDLIVPRGKKPNEYFWMGECVSEEAAAPRKRKQRCRADKLTQWFNTGGPGLILWDAIPKPYVYNASWLWPIEYVRALARHRLTFRRIPKQYMILKSAMTLLERAYGRHRVRLVFWFSQTASLSPLITGFITVSA